MSFGSMLQSSSCLQPARLSLAVELCGFPTESPRYAQESEVQSAFRRWPSPMGHPLTSVLAVPSCGAQPIAHQQPRTAQCEVIPGQLIGHPLVQGHIRGFDLCRQGHLPEPVKAGNVHPTVYGAEPHGQFQLHSRHRPARVCQRQHHMLPHPLLGFEQHPFGPHRTPNPPTAVAHRHFHTFRRQRQLRPCTTRIGRRLRFHSAKVQRVRPTLDHFDFEPDGQPHPAF